MLRLCVADKLIVRATPKGQAGFHLLNMNQRQIECTCVTVEVCLAGKYDVNNNPKGASGALFTKSKAQAVQPLIQLMREIGQKQGGKTPAQVAINWCLCKGTLPIPG